MKVLCEQCNNEITEHDKQAFIDKYNNWFCCEGCYQRNKEYWKSVSEEWNPEV